MQSALSCQRPRVPDQPASLAPLIDQMSAAIADHDAVRANELCVTLRRALRDVDGADGAALLAAVRLLREEAQGLRGAIRSSLKKRAGTRRGMRTYQQVTG